MSDFAVEIELVSKRYADHVAVRELSLAVPRGATYGLLGPNGAGKTTTIRMLLDIVAPDSGAIRLFGSPRRTRDATDRIGYLPEERGLYRKMQVRRVLRFLGQLKGLSRRDADRRAEEWLERLGLRTAERDWGRAKVDELSRGMQQKVQFIGALLHDPELVILDEPFSGLDPVNAQVLKDAVLDLQRRGRTIIFSTHIMESAEQMCDAVCIIANGQKVLDGALDDVKAMHARRDIAVALEEEPSPAVAAVLAERAFVRRTDDGNRHFEVRLAADADAQLLLRQLVAAGARLGRCEMVQPSLHEIFLERVGATDADQGRRDHG